MKIFGVRITPYSYGPYGMGWLGLKINWGIDTVGRSGYRRWAYIVISLGKRWGWDGYQKAWISHAYGLNFYWGKPKPIEYDEDEQVEEMGG